MEMSLSSIPVEQSRLIPTPTPTTVLYRIMKFPFQFLKKTFTLIFVLLPIAEEQLVELGCKRCKKASKCPANCQARNEFILLYSYH